MVAHGPWRTVADRMLSNVHSVWRTQAQRAALEQRHMDATFGGPTTDPEMETGPITPPAAPTFGPSGRPPRGAPPATSPRRPSAGALPRPGAGIPTAATPATILPTGAVLPRTTAWAVPAAVRGAVGGAMGPMLAAEYGAWQWIQRAVPRSGMMEAMRRFMH